MQVTKMQGSVAMVNIEGLYKNLLTLIIKILHKDQYKDVYVVFNMVQMFRISC